MNVIVKLLFLIAGFAMYAFVGYGVILLASFWDLANSKGPECCLAATTHYGNYAFDILAIGFVIGLVLGVRWILWDENSN